MIRVMIDINHPGQVHLFRHVVGILRERGHEALIVARDKDVTLRLLEAFDLPHVPGTARRPGFLNLAWELVSKTALITKTGRRFRSDILVSLGSPAAAMAARLLGVPHLALDDTEHSWEQYLLYSSFSRHILTPDCFKRDLGRKQIRYPGYHELTYLHPNRFTPDPAIPKRYGLSHLKKFFVVRFVSWKATHDLGEKGLSLVGKRELVRSLSAHGRVVITSEAELPREFEPYRMPVPPEDIHHVLAHAWLYIGEGATMASEAALLGVPAIYVNSLNLGYIEDQERLGLVYRRADEAEALALAIALAADPECRERHQGRLAALLSGKIDVAIWLASCIEAEAAGHL